MAKAKVEAPKEPETEKLAPKAEQIGIEIEEPDDVAAKAEPPQEDMFGKAIKQLKDIFKHDPTTAKTPKRKFFQRKVDAVSNLLMKAMNSMWPDDWLEEFEVAGETRCVAPKKDRYAKVLQPLARIADRHVDVKIDNPDWEDAGEAIWNAGELIWEMRANHKLLKILIEQERRNQYAAGQAQANNHANPAPGQIVVLDQLI